MSRKHPDLRRGLSLIEVLIALAFLAFGLGGIVELYAVQARYAAREARQARAARLAQSYLAQVQTGGYAAAEEKIRLLGKPGSPDRAALYSDWTRSPLDSEFRWNADLTRQTVNGAHCIRIGVVLEWDPAVASAAARLSPIRKEAVGYVVAP